MKTGQLLPLGVMAVFLVLGLGRRMRAQPVRPNRLLVTGGVIILVTLAALAPAYPVLLTPLGLVLAPVCLAAGVGLGWALVRTLRVWREPSGELWMKGGLPFAAVFVGALAIRLGVRFALTGDAFAPASPAELESPLGAVSTDLLLVSVGMWATRAAILYRRFRAGPAPP